MILDYLRVIPRDLFNEGKLLTELGFLSLAIHDNKDNIATVLEMVLTNDEDQGFCITQNDSDGSICVKNLFVYALRTATDFCDPDEVLFYTPLNSRDKNALRFYYRPTESEGVVSDRENFSIDFKTLLEVLQME